MAEPIANALSVLKFNAYQTPDFRERKGKPWILFGEKNDYPDYLVTLYQQSSKHSAIINGKVDYIIGKGWQPAESLEDENLIKRANDFIDRPNEEEDLMELSSKIALDLELFGGCAIKIKKNKGGDIIREHCPFHHLRTNEDRDEFFYTRNWKTIKPENNKDYTEYPAYRDKTGQGESIFYYIQYSPKTSEFPVYPLPEYIGCIPYIEIDYEIGNFHLNNIKNSFWGSFLMNFYNGIPNEEDQLALEKKIKKKFAGTDNAGRFILNFSDGKDFGADIQALTPNEMDKLFDQLNKTVQQEIFTGHKVTSPMLFGIKTEGQLGGRSEIVEAYEIFKNTYIQNRQKQLADIFNYLLTGNRLADNIQIIGKEPIQEKVSLDVVAQKMSDNEIREQAGLPPVEEAAADPSEDIKNKLSAMPPLLATKVLDTMTQDEIRMLAGLAPLPPGTVLPPRTSSDVPMKKQFSKEDEARVIEQFSQIGRPANDFNIIKVRRIWFSSDEDINGLVIKENKLLKQCFGNAVSGKVDDLSAKVLQYLDKNPDADAKEIAAALNIDTKKVNDAIQSLVEADYLMKDGNEWLITDSGADVLPPTDLPITSISVKYRYAKDPTLPGPVLLPTSREFCREIIGMDKLYDRKEIEKISNRMDYSVFLFRGGWYHNPQTNDTTPYCRHIWEQVVVTERRKGE
jgi:hypothetical protein